MGEKNSRSLGITELGSFDQDPRITTLCLLADFCANMLSFSITICPDKQGLAAASLLPDILCNRHFVLIPR